MTANNDAPRLISKEKHQRDSQTTSYPPHTQGSFIQQHQQHQQLLHSSGVPQPIVYSVYPPVPFSQVRQQQRTQHQNQQFLHHQAAHSQEFPLHYTPLRQIPIPALLPQRAMSNPETAPPQHGFFIDNMPLSTDNGDSDELVITPSLIDPTPLSTSAHAGVPLSLGATPPMVPIVEEVQTPPNPNLQIMHYGVPNNAANSSSLSTTSTDRTVVLLDHKRASAGKNSKKHTKSRPAFVTKLWTMVNDPSNNDLIDWFDDGSSFVVSNRELFVQMVLPKFFKHSNFASFVRQLNMYGWHKVQDVSSGAMHSDERWQFKNPCFQRGKPELLDQIVRNKPQEEQEQQEDELNGMSVKLLMNELNSLKNNQLKITHELSRVRHDNELLWQELFTSREKNTLQNDKIEKILQFLASVYGNRVQVLEDDVSNDGSQVQPYYQHSYNQYIDPQQHQQHQQQQQQHQQQQQQQQQQYQQQQQQQQDQMFKKPRLMIQQRTASVGSSSSNTPVRVSSVGESPIQEISRSPPATLNSDQILQLIDETNSERENESTGVDRPKPNPSLDNLSKTIEQQGQSIDDIITKLQNQQYADQSQNFDLDEYLNQDLLPGDDQFQAPVSSTPKPGSIKEIHDDDVEGDVGDLLLNPPKKRKAHR